MRNDSACVSLAPATARSTRAQAAARTVAVRRRAAARASTLPLAFWLFGPGLALAAQAPGAGPLEGDRVEWHVVEQGDTLQSLALKYLGDQALWTENVRLNPGVHPLRLKIGSRVRVLVERRRPPRSAEVSQVARRVDAQFQPEPWIPAKRGDQLKERDGLRTHERSSAELFFDDGSKLLVTEQSLVFLRDIGASVRGIPRESIEVLEGQVDLSHLPKRAQASEIEIVVADARARPKPGGSGPSLTRARRAEAGGAAVMVYGGRSDVEAAGQTLEVKRGMGTVIPKGLPPKPPEPLLGAPRTGGAHVAAYANPMLRWDPVNGAATYTLEVCSDAACASLLWRKAGVAETRQRTAALPSGSHHWRVTAASPSGLDGFPSAAAPLTIASDRADLDAPVVVAVLVGAGLVESPTRIVAGPESRLQLVAHDDASGVESVSYRWDGGAWREAPGAIEIPGSRAAGSLRRLEFRARDRAGHESEIWTVTVAPLGAPPPAPAVRPQPPQ